MSVDEDDEIESKTPTVPPGNPSGFSFSLSNPLFIGILSGLGWAGGNWLLDKVLPGDDEEEEDFIED